MQQLYSPSGVAVDATGNLFIADYNNNRHSQGGHQRDHHTRWQATVTMPESTLEATPATGARRPMRNWIGPLAWRWTLPATCSLRIPYNNVIRKVGTNGIITTVAGNGTIGATPATGARRPMRNCLLPSWRGGGRYRQPVYCGFVQQRHSQGRHQRHHHHGGGQRLRRRIRAAVVTPGTGVRRPMRNWTCPLAWRWTLPATCSLRITTTTVIREVGTNGIITTVAGNGYGAGTGVGGYTGDGGAATNAELDWPSGVAVDATGNLFIADTYNNVIRKVLIQGPTLVLNDVDSGNAGAYDVVVSSPYGSVTSSVVNLKRHASSSVQRHK